MTKGWSVTAAVVLILAGISQAQVAAGNPYEGSASGSAPNGSSEIDKLVFARLDSLGIKPAAICSDAVFLRRVFLDVIGTLPTAKEAREFLADKSPDKRRKLIDRLLNRGEFADYWAMKWADILRIKAEFPINLWPNAAELYHRWVRQSLRDNKPINRFAREMLTATGSNFCVPEVNFYRAVQSKDANTLAKAVALTFMGCRFEKWPVGRQKAMAMFFDSVGYKSTAEWKEQIVFFDPKKPSGHATRQAVLPDGTKVTLPAGVDGRKIFADWLIRADNEYFARNIANRVWSWLIGRGIIHQPDDIRPDNPPIHPKLLRLLEKKLIASNWNVKALMRMILNSRTYQLSSIPKSDKPEAEANFAVYPIRRLQAEVLVDALCQITGTTERYTSAIPEPFTYIPPRQRTIALADGSITSSFLEMFGRPSRDTGFESERNNRPTSAQRLHMINSSHVQKKIERGWRLRTLLRSRMAPREKVRTLYLTILSRYPTAAELKIITDYAGKHKGARGQDAIVDMVWALMNSSEFLYRH